MKLGALNCFFNRFIQSTPLGNALLLPILVPFIVAAGLTIGGSLRTAQQSTQRQVEQLQEEIAHRVEDNLEQYFSQSVIALDLTLQEVQTGQLDSGDLKQLEEHFWKQSQVFTKLNNIYWGNARGESVSIIRRANGRQELAMSTSTPGVKVRFQIDEQGKPRELLQEYSYDPRQRPWYQLAVDKQQKQWTEVYPWSNLPMLGITLTQPYRNQQGELQGVFAIDLTLDGIQQILRQLPIAQIGQVVILDRSGLLVASSTEEFPFVIKGDKAERLDPKQSTNSVTRIMTQQLDQHLTQDLESQLQPEAHLQDQMLRQTDAKGKNYLIHSKAWKDEWGLDWTIMTAVPEDKILGQIHRNTRNTTVLNIGAFFVAAALGLLMSHWITYQIKAKNNRIEQQQIVLKGRAQELAKTLQTLKTTQSKLIESSTMAALGRLVAGVAHEVNTPVGTAMLAASVLENETRLLKEDPDLEQVSKDILHVPALDEIQDYLDTAEECSQLILKNLQRAGELVQSFKQVAVDQTQTQTRRFNLKDYIEEVIQSLSPQIDSERYRIQVDGDQTLDMESDPGAIAQIITNLVMNSLIHAYEPGESGYIKIALFRIELEGQSDSIQLHYQDNGKGIPPQDLEQIFEPFFTTGHSPQNSGLGLHLVYNLVTQRLQGTISVSSTANHGTQFVLRFPWSTNS